MLFRWSPKIAKKPREKHFQSGYSGGAKWYGFPVSGAKWKTGHRFSVVLRRSFPISMSSVVFVAGLDSQLVVTAHFHANGRSGSCG
jgi:hypothetical protein